MSSRRGFPFAKVVTGLAIAFGVALGLCGMSVIMAGLGATAGSPLRALAGPAMGILGLIGLVAMVVTGPALVIMVIAWVIAELVGSPGGSDPQKPLSDSEARPDDDRDQR